MASHPFTRQSENPANVLGVVLPTSVLLAEEQLPASPASSATCFAGARAALAGSSKPCAVYLMAPHIFDRVYGPHEREDIAALADVSTCFLTPEDWRKHPEVTAEAEWIFSSWSMPFVNEEFLRAFPRLRTIFYAAGTIKGFATEAMWRRGITVTSANAANAVPVAEFTVAQIILSLKSFWRMAREFTRENRVSPREIPSPGAYNATVGLISLGLIGRLVAQQLQTFRLKVIAYDPYFDPKAAAELGLELCTLDELFSRSDVVSCHAPLLRETEKLLRKSHFERMKPHATFVNTARGALVDENGLAEVFAQRPDLFALLDVTSPEPPAADSPLYELPNVILTPHIAGSKNWECQRMARYMVDEAARLLAGEPLLYGVTPAQLQRMA